MTDVTDESRRVMTRFWAAMQANDWRAASELFDDASELEWPQSGERIRGRENFVAINAGYPAAGIWRFTVDRLVAEGETVVTDVAVTDGVAVARAITFSTVHGGRIVRQVEYWPDPFDAPAWRAPWVER